MKRKQMIGLGVVAGFGILTGVASGQDGGGTILFEPGVIVDQFPNPVGGHLAIDGYGNVYVATVDGTGGDRDIYFNRSTDFGVTFERPYRTVGGVGNPGWAVYHQIAANGTNDVYVVWEDLRSGSHAYINVSNDGGITFNGETRVDNVGFAGQPRVAADDAGRVFVTHSTGSGQVRAAVSTDHGHTFGQQQTITGGFPGDMSSVATDGQGGVYVVFGDPPSLDFYFTRSLDAGVTWAAPVHLGNFGQYYSWAQSAHVAAEGDSVYVTWAADYGQGWDVYLATSTDAGATFGAATLVSVDARPNRPFGFNSPFAVSGGVVVVVWNLPGETWFAVSTDGGATFAPAVTATDGYVNKIALSDGLLYAAYQPFDDNTVVGFALGVVADPELRACRLANETIPALGLELFNGPNDNANSGRRNSLANRAQEACDAIMIGDYDAAIELLASLLKKIDGQSPPPDWMFDSPEKSSLADEVSSLIATLSS